MKIRPVSAVATILTAILLLTGTVFAADSPAQTGDEAREELKQGVQAFKAANYDKAIEHFRSALAYDPELTVAQLYLATAVASRFVPGALSEKNIAVAYEAIAEFEKVLVVEPENTNALRTIASIYFQIKEMDMAKETRRRLIEIEPENPEHYYAIGVINWSIAFEARNIVRAELGIKNSPDEPLPDEQAHALGAEIGELVEEAIEALEKARELDPNDWQIVTYLNLIYREKADIASDSNDREDLLHRSDVLLDEARRLQKLPVETEPEI